MSSRDGGHEPQRPDRLVSLLGPQELPPTTADWRGDALEGSDHSRFEDLKPPQDDFDEGRARSVCAEVSRRFLLDFSPALLLLKEEDRLRVQAIVAYSRTLFDFTHDRSLEGERLSQINRWQFALEQSLEGDHVGQPVFVLLGLLHRRRPWRRQGLDRLASLARSRVSETSGSTTARAQQEAIELVQAFATLWIERPLSVGLAPVAAAVLRTYSVLSRTEGLLSRQECQELRGVLQDGLDRIEELPRGFRRAFFFAHHAALALLGQAERRRHDQRAPRLGIALRLFLLTKARLRYLRK